MELTQNTERRGCWRGRVVAVGDDAVVLDRAVLVERRRRGERREKKRIGKRENERGSATKVSL